MTQTRDEKEAELNAGYAAATPALQAAIAKRAEIVKKEAANVKKENEAKK